MKKFKQILCVTLLYTTAVSAQVNRSFETRASIETTGNIEIIGNTLLTCSGAGNCSNVQNGRVNGGNNNTQMVFINTDTTAGFSNSSNATLSIPANSTIEYAALYWGGRASSTDINRNTIQIKPPGTANYTTVTAIQLDTYSNDGSIGSRPYQAVADITTVVNNAGNGIYTVGDLTALTGQDSLGFYGGWSLAIIYSNSAESFKHLSLMDGAVRVINTNTETITIPDIITPQTGSFNTFLGALIWEGDQDITGDSIQFEGTTISNTLNPNDNFWNSTITRYDNHLTSKNPDHRNQMGMDIDIIDVSGLLPNGLTNADFAFVTDGDWYYAHALLFATDLNVPDFSSTMTKTATDVNGGSIEAGDVIEYTITFSNTGQDTATNVILTDPIPNHMTYVANSLEITSADVGPVGSMSDSSGNDAAEYDASGNQVVFRVGAGANGSSGGSLAENEGATVNFRTTINTDSPLGDITNTATVNSNSMTLPDQSFSSDAEVTITIVNVPPPAPICTVSPDPANNGTPLTATCTGVESGASLSIPGYTCGAESGNQVVCTATAGQNDVDGDETATVTDPAGNTNTTPVNFTLDNTPPPAPVCTVSPNPANNGTPLTATCTGVESGASLSIPGYTCGAESGNQVVCTATAGQNDVDGDETATVTDPAGNTNTTPVNFTLDNTPPAAPIIISPINGDITNDNTPVISGTSEPGSTVTVTGPNGETCMAVTDQNGNWSCEIAPSVQEGDNTFNAVATDEAGNNSPTTTVSIILDTIAPDAPTVDTPTNGAPITGTGEPGATITVTTPSGATCITTVQQDGTWSCTLSPTPNDGEDITVVQEDQAGNESPPIIIANGIDTQPPSDPVIVYPIDGSTTNDNNPLVTGTGEPGSTITVSGPDGQNCQALVDQNGDWSCTLDASLQDGVNIITAVASDDAGNESGEESVTINVQSGLTHDIDISFDGAELVTTEMGGSDTFTVALTLTPTADVVLNVSSSNTDEGTVAPTTLTFTPSNWNQPQTVTVTGVDDTVYDFDQDYQIITATLMSADNNFNGVDPVDIDAVNIDDDEMPDVSAYLTNCVAGVQPNMPLTYYLTVRNEGNKNIDDAVVTAILGAHVAEASWVCEPFAGANCDTIIGTSDINTTVDLPVDAYAIFTMHTTVTGDLLDFIDSSAAIAMPQNETDIDLSNNNSADSDLIYQFIFKNGFDCAFPGTLQSTHQNLIQILNQ